VAGRSVLLVATSTFSIGAREYAASIQSRGVLIDGPRLAELMILHPVGIQVKSSLHVVVVVDDNFFDQVRREDSDVRGTRGERWGRGTLAGPHCPVTSTASTY
jgi:hypothetical protein